MFKLSFLILAVLLIATVLISKVQILGFRSMVILTGSMEPIIAPGALLYSRKEPYYQKGDIIAFERENMTITHRIIGTKDSLFITKGDANNAADIKLVKPQEVVGKMVLQIPYLGRIFLFVKTIPGLTLLIIIPTLLFIALEIRNIKFEWEKELQKKFREKLERNE